MTFLSYELENGGYIIDAHGVEHPDCPQPDNSVRMNLFPSGWIILPKKSGKDNTCYSIVTCTLHLDIKVPYLPSAFLSMVITTQPLMIDRLRKVINEKQKEKERLLELSKQKEISRESKFEDFIQSFDSKEECVTYFLQKFERMDPESLQKALEVLPITMRVSKEITSERELLEQV